MTYRDENQEEETPQRGVSSLRSLFEKRVEVRPVGNSDPSKPATPVIPNRPNRDDQSRTRADSRGVSLDLPRQVSPERLNVRASPHLLPSASVSLDSARWTPRLRPKSMLGQFSPPRSPPRSPPKSPFLVTVDSPDTSPRAGVVPADRYGRHSVDQARTLEASRNSSPVRLERTPLRLPPPQLNTTLTGADTTIGRAIEKPRSSIDTQQMPRTPNIGLNPPPVNRAAKPTTFGGKAKTTSVHTAQQGSTLLPVTPREGHDERISPFSTPPSEPEDLVEYDPTPSIPYTSKPRVNPETQSRPTNRGLGPSNQVSRAGGTAAMDNFSQRLQTIAQDERPSIRAVTTFSRSTRGSSPEKPSLPPRIPQQAGPDDPVALHNPTTSQPSRSSMEARPKTNLKTTEDFSAQQSAVARSGRPVQREEHARFVPPLPRRTVTYDVRPSTVTMPAESRTPQLPSRPSVDSARPSIDKGLIRSSNWQPSPDRSDTAEDTGVSFEGAAVDYPDNSQTNRRPPRLERGIQEIHTRYETKLVAVSGEFVCTSGYITRVWSLLTGEQLMSISHGETIKATAVAFKPAQKVEDEGKRIWIGTNMGELQEIDIPSQSLSASSRSAHGRAPLTKIFRQGPDLWSLDDDGKWVVWPPNESGVPDLTIPPQGCRIPRNATFSMVVGDNLWAAYGKEIQVYHHDLQTRTAVQVLSKPLMQSGVGEVTSGAVMSKQPDRVYLGHIDGKITIYSSKDYSCLNIINVSLYKISNLTGVGDYLWAAFNTGMIYVYDTTCAPWKVKKDWRAHQSTIAGFVSDRSSIWKLDRLQVVSLGTDSFLQVWDGMLRDDWLEQDLQQNDMEYCQFNEVSALVITWNAGASKPKDLRHDQRDSNFFRELLTAPDVPPDILVFGFQELVDLEDKKVTAKSLFKSKKKDSVDHEHMSHQYRGWRDELTTQINSILGIHGPYILLHTANLIGLFTCVYVKASLKPRLRFLNAAEVKLGMGGLHGNKGALLVRFILDDSSLCFVNCHLAAGQKHTVNRNNDVAAIMESSSLAFHDDPAVRSDVFVGGGDGCMILDHEICILNGDLNYRIDAIPRDTVIAAVREQNLAKLLDRDQLLTSRRKNPGFRLRVFQENHITFAPTYKYDVGTDRYDTSEKKRSPAWCDRILYRGLGRVKQLNYRRHEVHASDHRPVSALFKLRVKTIDQKRKGQTMASSMERFEVVKQRIAMDVKLDYLINVFGLSLVESRRLLQ